jgi:hypothetical protein
MGLGEDPPEPYAAQTRQNTNTPWVASTVPVDVDLDGLRDYAKHMLEGQLDVSSRSAHLKHLHDMPNAAWTGVSLGEAMFAKSQLQANASELNTYLYYLGQTLFNIGCAAQTVADCYGAADGTSAASINDVLFAFGDKSHGRPRGLPENIGKTISEAQREGAQPSDALPADSAEWSEPEETIVSPYESRTTSTAPNGQTQIISTQYVPSSGQTIVTTTILNAGGKEMSSSRTVTSGHWDSTTNSNVSTTTSYRGDTVSGTTRTTTTYSGGTVTREVTESQDGQGNVTGRRTESTDQTTGTQTETTSSVDKDGKEKETDRVVIGQNTDDPRSDPTPIAQEYDPYMRGR